MCVRGEERERGREREREEKCMAESTKYIERDIKRLKFEDEVY